MGICVVEVSGKIYVGIGISRDSQRVAGQGEVLGIGIVQVWGKIDGFGCFSVVLEREGESVGSNGEGIDGLVIRVVEVGREIYGLRSFSVVLEREGEDITREREDIDGLVVVCRLNKTICISRRTIRIKSLVWEITPYRRSSKSDCDMRTKQ